MRDRIDSVSMTVLRPFDIGYLRAPTLAGIAASLATVGIATAVLAGVIAVTDIRHISIGYVIPVVFSAVRFGTVESLIAALLAVAASAFFFYPPIFSLHVDDPQQITDLVLFIFVAIVIGHLAARLREEAARANRRENEASMRAQADRFRDALIGSVSHELRTPLSSILGAATVLAGAPAVQRDPQLAALANVAREEAVRLNNDIQNLLDATRISSQGVEPKLSWTEPGDIVNSALERRRAMLAGHQVDVRLPDNLPLIYVDSVLVEQALIQIIDNAGRYSAAGSRIEIEGHQHGNQMTLSVTDHGTGIAPEDKAKLGERFFRGSRHSATTTGSGLGLWIAKAFMSAHGGTVTMDSVDGGGGTTVSLLLPVPLMSADQMSAPHE
jgi:K+-sensing histidine kinase KdpD